MRSLILSAVAVVAFAFAGNAAQAERLTEKPLVDANWVEANLDNPSLVVVDIRSMTKEGSPYDAGHIPGRFMRLMASSAGVPRSMMLSACCRLWM